jgi:hypothetical protein
MLDIFEKWKNKIVRYVETKIGLVKLEFVERASGVLSYFIFAMILLFVGFGVFLFLGFGLAELFTTLMESRMAGFFLAALCYVLLALLLIALRKPISASLSNIFIRLLTERKKEKSEDDQDEEEEDEA